MLHLKRPVEKQYNSGYYVDLNCNERDLTYSTFIKLCSPNLKQTCKNIHILIFFNETLGNCFSSLLSMSLIFVSFMDLIKREPQIRRRSIKLPNSLSQNSRLSSVYFTVPIPPALLLKMHSIRKNSSCWSPPQFSCVFRPNFYTKTMKFYTRIHK